jgi:hypothetical protein
MEDLGEPRVYVLPGCDDDEALIAHVAGCERFQDLLPMV